MAVSEVTLTTLSGANVAGSLGGPLSGGNPGIEFPVEKIELKEMAEKTETTGSTDYQSTQNQDGSVKQVIWKAFGEGNSGWSGTIEANWRANSGIIPPTLRKGATYAAWFYVRRPGVNGPTDAGSFYQGNIFIDDKT